MGGHHPNSLEEWERGAKGHKQTLMLLFNTTKLFFVDFGIVNEYSVFLPFKKNKKNIYIYYFFVEWDADFITDYVTLTLFFAISINERIQIASLVLLDPMFSTFKNNC